MANDWTPIAKPQPDTGQFWNKVINLERGTVPKVQVTYHHTICQHCEEAPCIEACPAGAIYRSPDGIVIIDPESAGVTSSVWKPAPMRTSSTLTTT